jgi:DNA-directed RNA polymerase specialized sigma24 family protein
MRGLLAAAGLALRRARAAPGRWLPVAAPIALAVALFGALSASGVVAGDHAARRALERLPAAQRAVVLTWSGGAGPATDAAARRSLGRMGAGSVTRGVLLFPSDFGRAIVQLAAIAPLAPYVHLLSGRLPRGPCVPERCEVLHVQGEPAPPPALAARGLHLAVVGRALVTSASALGFTTKRADFGREGAGHRPPLLVSADPDGVDGLAALDAAARAQSWSAPLDIAALHAWQLDATVRRIADEHQRLDTVAHGFTVASPLLALQSARTRSLIAPGRLSAAGAAAAAALAAFLILAAGGLRTGLLAEDARLRRSGATAAQRGVLALAETAMPVAAGLLAGAALAVGVAVLRARAGGVSSSHVLDEAAGGAAGRMAIVAVAGWGLALAAARAPARAGRVLAGATLIAGAALLVGMLAPRGDAVSDPLSGAVIPIAGAAAGLLLALVLPALLRRVARAAPRRRPLARIALLELARRPGAATVAAAGLAVSTGLAGFAFAYRTTLDRSRSDQADHRVPLAATVLPGADFRSPLAVRPREAWQRLDGAAEAVPVLRRVAFLLAGPTRDPVALVALPSEALGTLPTWRAADAAGDHRALAHRLVRAPFDRAEAGIPLPPAARTVSLTARADGDNVDVVLLVRARAGTLERVELGQARRAGGALRVPLPARARGGVLLGLALSPDRGLIAVNGHQSAEGAGGNRALGVLRFGALHAGTATISLDEMRPHGAIGGRASALTYHLTGPAELRLPQPSDKAALPVLADPATAHDAALSEDVELDVLGVQVRAHVVGVVRRFPTVPSGHAVVLADGAALAGALDAQVPGSGEARELWLAAQPGQEHRLDAAVAGAARRTGLVVHTHAAVRRAIDAEPIAREVLGALAAAALLAAALALAGVAVAVRRALRDGSAALLDLEAQGLGPGELRGGLRLRGAAIAMAGVVPGMLLALALTRLVTGAVRAGAVGPPDPPLVTVVPWGTGALAAVVLLAAAVALGALAAAPALREPVPLTAPSAEGEAEAA